MAELTKTPGGGGAGVLWIMMPFLLKLGAEFAAVPVFQPLVPVRPPSHVRTFAGVKEGLAAWPSRGGTELDSWQSQHPKWFADQLLSTMWTSTSIHCQKNIQWPFDALFYIDPRLTPPATRRRMKIRKDSQGISCGQSCPLLQPWAKREATASEEFHGSWVTKVGDVWVG